MTGALRHALERLETAGARLRARDEQSVVDALGETWSRIADPERAAGRRAREELPGSTGLTLASVAWALAATFEHLGRDLPRAARAVRPADGALATPHHLGAVVLAGNVFTACVRPLTLGLLARVPLIVKASSRDDALPRLFADTLAEVDAELAEACAVVTFPGGSEALEATLLGRASFVSAYGGDATLASLRARTRVSTVFVGHGHGLGVGLARARALAEDVDEVAAKFAIDVAAYDQRGCLSPHAILVERGSVTAERFARALAEALDGLEPRMPRGALPTEVGPAQLRWRGVAGARGPLHEGRASAVAVGELDAAIRPSPGWRNVLVLETSWPQATARLDALGVHLKCLGVAGPQEAVLRDLPASVTPRICAAGEMQRLGLLEPTDGQPPWFGMTRVASVVAL